MTKHAHLIDILPGFLMALAVTLVAYLLQELQFVLLGECLFEGLVIALVLGIAIRSAIPLSPVFRRGIDFSAKLLLEIAVVLLGASISLATVRESGLALFIGIVAIVVVSLGIGFAVGRLLGLPRRLAILVACGNSICGNSAIAAAAPVIGADAQEVAASIAFTAVLGVGAVLAMPLLGTAAALTQWQYGVFAGLTAYAVPQVVAAAAPVGLVSLQTGTLVKLIRVMMLGPVLLALGLVHGARGNRVAMRHAMPWFIAGFAVMMLCRSGGLFPPTVLQAMSWTSGTLTTVAMAGLGLSVDIRSVASAGGRVMLAAIASLGMLAAASLGLVALLAGA